MYLLLTATAIAPIIIVLSVLFICCGCHSKYDDHEQLGKGVVIKAGTKLKPTTNKPKNNKKPSDVVKERNSKQYSTKLTRTEKKVMIVDSKECPNSYGDQHSTRTAMKKQTKPKSDCGEAFHFSEGNRQGKENDTTETNSDSSDLESLKTTPSNVQDGTINFSTPPLSKAKKKKSHFVINLTPMSSGSEMAETQLQSVDIANNDSRPKAYNVFFSTGKTNQKKSINSKHFKPALQDSVRPSLEEGGMHSIASPKRIYQSPGFRCCCNCSKISKQTCYHGSKGKSQDHTIIDIPDNQNNPTMNNNMQKNLQNGYPYVNQTAFQWNQNTGQTNVNSMYGQPQNTFRNSSNATYEQNAAPTCTFPPYWNQNGGPVNSTTVGVSNSMWNSEQYQQNGIPQVFHTVYQGNQISAQDHAVMKSQFQWNQNDSRLNNNYGKQPRAFGTNPQQQAQQNRGDFYENYADKWDRFQAPQGIFSNINNPSNMDNFKDPGIRTIQTDDRNVRRAPLCSKDVPGDAWNLSHTSNEIAKENYNRSSSINPQHNEPISDYRFKHQDIHNKSTFPMTRVPADCRPFAPIRQESTLERSVRNCNTQPKYACGALSDKTNDSRWNYSFILPTKPCCKTFVTHGYRRSPHKHARGCYDANHDLTCGRKRSTCRISRGYSVRRYGEEERKFPSVIMSDCGDGVNMHSRHEIASCCRNYETSSAINLSRKTTCSKEYQEDRPMPNTCKYVPDKSLKDRFSGCPNCEPSFKPNFCKFIGQEYPRNALKHPRKSLPDNRLYFPCSEGLEAIKESDIEVEDLDDNSSLSSVEIVKNVTPLRTPKMKYVPLTDDRKDFHGVSKVDRREVNPGPNKRNLDNRKKNVHHPNSSRRLDSRARRNNARDRRCQISESCLIDEETGEPVLESNPVRHPGPAEVARRKTATKDKFADPEDCSQCRMEHKQTNDHEEHTRGGPKTLKDPPVTSKYVERLKNASLADATRLSSPPSVQRDETIREHSTPSSENQRSSSRTLGPESNENQFAPSSTDVQQTQLSTSPPPAPPLPPEVPPKPEKQKKIKKQLDKARYYPTVQDNVLQELKDKLMSTGRWKGPMDNDNSE